MTQRTKNFFKDWWQAIAIGITLQVLVGIVIGVGSIQIGLYQVNENKKQIEVLSQSNYELQMNQLFIAIKEELDQELPHNYTNTRAGK